MKARTGFDRSRRRNRRSRGVTVVHAHTGDHAYIYLVVNGARLIGSVELPLDDLERVTGEVFSRIDRVAVEGPILTAVHRYIGAHFAIRTNQDTAAILLGETRVRLLPSGPYVYIDYEVADFDLGRPNRLEVRYDALIESIPDRQALLIAYVSRGWSGLYRHSESRFEFDGDRRETVIEIDKPTALENLMASSAQAVRLVRGKAKGLRSRLRKSVGEA